MKNSSKRFSASPWMKWAVPVMFFLLATGLFATIVVVALSMIGVTPGQ